MSGNFIKDSEEIKEPVVEWSEEEGYVQGKLWIKADQETHRMDGYMNWK